MPIDPSQRSGAAGFSLDAVNGWRGLGALAIVFGHFGAATDFLPYRDLEPLRLVVDMFFVLSGVVIAKAYSAQLASPRNIPGYLLRRVGRIWPVQVATLAVLVGYELLKFALQARGTHAFTSPPFDPNGLNILRAIPTNLLLVQALGIHDRETWNFPSWSLSVEFATYAAFAAVCLVSPVLRRLLSVATILASLVILATIAPTGMHSTFDFGIFRCLAGFFAGTLLFDVLARWRLPRWPLPTLVEIAAIAGVVVWLALSSETRVVFLAPFVFCLFVLMFVDGRGALSRVLRSKPLQMLAELSFTIYMVHALLLVFLLAGLHALEHWSGHALFLRVPEPAAGQPGVPAMLDLLHIDGIAPKWAIGGLYLAGVLLASWIVYRLVEVPGRIAFGRLAKRASAVIERRGAVASREPMPIESLEQTQ